MFTISQLSQCAPKTLRHYDSIELLKPFCATDGGHRTFNEDDIFKTSTNSISKESRLFLKGNQAAD